jgi:hypothetical protein
VIPKLAETSTGDTLTQKDARIALARPVFPPQAVEEVDRRAEAQTEGDDQRHHARGDDGFAPAQAGTVQRVAIAVPGLSRGRDVVARGMRCPSRRGSWEG